MLAHASTLILVALLSSCAGMKVLKNPPAPTTPAKSGLTVGSPVSGGITVQKVGFWCDAKGGMLTFGAFGSTEEAARANAQAQCHKVFADSPCEIAACRPA